MLGQAIKDRFSSGDSGIAVEEVIATWTSIADMETTGKQNLFSHWSFT